MSVVDGFHLDRLDTWGEEQQFTVDPERCKAYAEATNYPLGPRLDGGYPPPFSRWFRSSPSWPSRRRRWWARI